MKYITITIPVPSVSPRDLIRVPRYYWWISFLLFPSLVWIVLNHEVWPWDQAWYGQVATDLWFSAKHSVRLWMSTMADGINMKPPGIVWLGQFFVPLWRVFGSIEAALLSSILLTQFAMLVVLFRIGQGMFANARLAVFAGILFASACRLFIGLSHQMLVEPLQALSVAWVFYVALRSPEWPKSRIVVHLIAALIVGVLAKATTPLYCLCPCLYAAYFLLRRSGIPDFAAEWKTGSSRVLMLLVPCLALMAGVWYLRHFSDVWQHVRNASYGDVALEYGSRDTVAHKLVVWWGLLSSSFLGPYLAWALPVAFLVAIVFNGARRMPPNRPANRWIEHLSVLSALQIGLMLFVFSVNITVESRYMFALLPCLAILFMQICSLLPRKAAIALMTVGAVQWVVVNGASLGLIPEPGGPSQWLVSFQADSSRFDELTRVVQLTAIARKYNIVGVDEPWLNANSAQFFASKLSLATGVRSYYTSLGYAQKDVSAAMRRIDEFQPQYLITLAESHQRNPPNFVNLVALPVLQRMRIDARFTPVPFPNQGGIVLFRFAGGESPGRNASAVPIGIAPANRADSSGGTGPHCPSQGRQAFPAPDRRLAWPRINANSG
jgi:hypothetical protein